VRIAGVGATTLQFSGLIDDFSIAISPVLFGTGRPPV
jgi:hypothetical protein